MFECHQLVNDRQLWHTAWMIIDEIAPFDETAPIPRGVADYFWQEAYDRRALEGELLALFRRWGYGDVIPPMFEFADVVDARSSAKLKEQLYRFLDRDGRMLALRPEMTIAVARLVGTRLHDWPMPQRFCYAGSVFRHIESRGGRQREFRQAGVELIGSDSPQADAEILALTIRALESAGLDQFRLVIGQLHYFAGLLQDLALEPPKEAALLHAIDRNSAPELELFLRDTPLRTQQRRTVEEIPTLSGADVLSVIDRADRLCLNYTMHSALENLRAIFSGLVMHGLSEHVFLDLTEINDLGYYTGLTFEALAPGHGFSLAGGGRYNHLIETFGAQQPAVGVALGVDRLYDAARQQQTQSTPLPRMPQLLVDPGGGADGMALVEQLRQRGVRVVVEVNDRTQATLVVDRVEGGHQRLLFCVDGALDLYEPGAATPRRLSAEQLLEESANWSE